MTAVFDASEIGRLAIDLTKAPGKVQSGIYPLLKKGAQNVKEGMAKDVGGHPHFRHLPRAVTYDIFPTGLRSLEAEIGFDKGLPQGALANIAAFGTSKNGPVFNHTAALDREVPGFQDAVAALGAGALD